MDNPSADNAKHGQAAPVGVVAVLGTNETASAVAVYLRRAGWAVVMSHDPFPPVIRRRMAFYDTLFGDRVVIEGTAATCAESSMELRAALLTSNEVVATPLDLSDLMVACRIDVLIDARMQKYRVKPDLRWLAGLTIGLGPGFEGGANCDIAIETHPALAGTMVRKGRLAEPDHLPMRLGNAGGERFVRAREQGVWHTPVEIGTRVFRDFIVGRLDGAPVRAPFDGLIRGIARDGITVPAGVKILEIDPRNRRARWTGIDNRGHSIGRAALEAVRSHVPARVFGGVMP